MAWSRKVWLVPSVAGAVLMAAAGVAPEEALSNLSKWAELLGLSETASWLAVDWADKWAFVIGATIVLFSVTMYFRLQILRIWHSIRSYPIKWDFKGFLGANWRERRAVYVTVFQISGENVSRRPVEILDAKIQSDIMGGQIDVTFKTNGGYTPAKNLNPIPPGAKFNAHALFYDPRSKGPDEREGLSEDVFLASWGEFQFNVKTRKRNYKRRFSNQEIIKDIARAKPPPVAIRRISRKDVRVDHKNQISFIKFNPNTNEIIDAGNVMSYDDNGSGDYGITFAISLDENELICTAIGETPRDFEIVSFTPDYIRIKFKIDPEIVHLRFGR